MQLLYKYRNVFIWIIFSVVLALTIPLVVVQVYRDEIKLKVESKIDENVHAVVTFDKLDYSFLYHFPNLTMALNNVHVSGINEFEHDTLAHIDRIDVDFNWFKIIFQNKIEVERIVLNKPAIHFLVLHDGNANYNILKADTITSNADSIFFSTISLDQFEIRDGVFSYINYPENRWLELHGMDHDGKLSIKNNNVAYSAATNIQHVSMSDDDVRYIHEKALKLDLDIEFDMHSNRCSIKENSVRVNKFLFGMDGAITFLPKGYDIDLTFDSKQTPFSDIISLVPNAYQHNLKNVQTEGLLEFSGNIKGKYFDSSDVLPAFHIDFKIADAMLQVPEFPSKIKDIQCELVVDNASGIMDSTIFDLKTFNVNFGGHPIKGRYKMQGFTKMQIDADILAELEFETIEKIFPVNHFDINGKLNFELKAKGVYSKTENRISSIPTFDLNLTVSDGTIKYDSATATFHDIELFLNSSNADGNPHHTIINLKAFQMYLGENSVSGNMILKGLNPYYIQSEWKASMNLADIESVYPANNNTIKGQFQTDVQIDGMYDQDKNLFPSINALVSLTNGYLKTPRYPEPIENINFNARAENKTGKAENTRIDFEQLNFLLEGNPFSLNGYVEDFIKMNYDFNIKGILDLEKLTKVFPIEGTTVSGIVNSDIESSGSIQDIENGDYSKIACSGNVVLSNIKYRSPAWRVPLHLNDVNLKLTPSKIVMNKCSGRVGRTKFAMTGDLTNYMYFVTSNNDMITGTMKLTSDTLDLTRWIDKTHSKRRTGLVPDETLNTPIPEPSAWIVPKNVNIVFDSEIANVFYQDLHITKLKGEITVKNGVLTLSETGFNSLNAFFSVNGDYNTTDIKHPLFAVHVNVDKLDINKAYKEIAFVRKLAPAAGDTYGLVSLNYTFAGELNQQGVIRLPTLKGGGNITIKDAKINGMKMFDEISKSAKKQDMKNPDLKNFSMDSYIADNRLSIRPFSLKVNGLNADIEGSNDLTGGNLNYLIKIELIPIDKMKIPFHVTGTYDDPKVSMGKGRN